MVAAIIKECAADPQKIVFALRFQRDAWPDPGVDKDRATPFVQQGQRLKKRVVRNRYTLRRFLRTASVPEAVGVAGSVSLVHSQRGEGGPVYSTLARVPLV